MDNYKTSDYCAVCNESPESGTHLMGPRHHDYVPPTADDICTCGRPRGSQVHAFDAPQGHKWMPETTVPVPLEAALRASTTLHNDPNMVAIDERGRVLTAPSLMRVMVEDRPGMPQFGVLVGMLLDEHGDMQSVVRLDHYGMMLKTFHPSKVTPVTPEQEENYKP